MSFGKVKEQTSVKKPMFVTLEDGRTVKMSTYERIVKEAERNDQSPPKLKSPESRN
jgi:hypothetical protein